MKRLLASRRRLLAAGALAAVAVVVAASYGYAAVTATNQTYTGCLQGGSITNVAIGSAPTKACPNNAVQISWSQTGPQGLPGQNGAPGAPGVSVSSATEPPGVNCAQGGSKFTAANGVTYACNGTKGDKGDPGANGTNGTNGTNGVSVTSAAELPGANCADGGSKFTAANGVTYACNGAKGDKGDPGADGKDGKDGTSLIGSACSLPSGAPGTVQMSVGANGAISFLCQRDTDLCANVPSYPNATTHCDPDTGTLSITCSAGFADADNDITTGCESNLQTDPANCGTVGNNVLNLPNVADATCVNGVAVIGACNPNYADANNVPSDGCESNLMTDPFNCGTVGHDVFDLPGARGGCVNGQGVIVACLPGFADVDQQWQDGCEVSLSSDPDNCGAVGNAIPPDGYQHANWTCNNGSIAIRGCVTGWLDLNGSVMDGCEAQADPDLNGNTQNTAINLGPQDCFDNNVRTITGSIATPLDNDWYVVQADGSFFCVDDFGSTWSGSPQIAYDVITNRTTRSNMTVGFTATDFYSDGTFIYIHVHQFGGTNAPNSYSLQFHL
jgi:hypothetical protein